MKPIDERLQEADILARTLYGEAKEEGLLGIEAIANVILNRVKASALYPGCWWGKTVSEVCLKPFQFPCWNPSHADFQELIRADGDDPVFRLCERVAKRALNGFLTDSVNGATHYHALSVHPAWARKLIPVAEVGNYVFYKEVL